ncbi:hypothetical protein [Streptomyces sp. NBC_01451]|uniref:hypothetical protein n=1 Tax=Streptomyces sp. NBC_01451 TaxID=2903872 RepID=UPI002E320499|nr:hypothetical protein [Streptomyces sp. NBC_01451]
MQSQTLLDAGQAPDMIPRGPGGTPLAFNLQGEPISVREAIELADNLDHCTLLWTPVTLASGRLAIVRTLFRVFDDEASQRAVPEGHVPQLYASVLFTPAPENRFLKRLWTYGSPAEAHAGHPEAVIEFQSGRVDVDL